MVMYMCNLIKPNWNCIKCHSTWGKSKKHKQNCLYTQPKWLWAQIVQIIYKIYAYFPEFKGGLPVQWRESVNIHQVEVRVLCGILICGINNFLLRDAVDIRSIIHIYVYCKWSSRSISCANYHSGTTAQSNLITDQI